MKKILILAGVLVFTIGAGIVFLFAGPVPQQQGQATGSSTAQTDAKKYIEIVDPAGFVNTHDQPIKIGDYIGKKVIMLDVMTYSCINCQRTFPYTVAWYNKYKDDGFIIIGIHTPEFAFEKDKQNVEDAMKRFGITFPVVLDNNYGTWNAYGNQYWPRKYLIDIHGNIVYDHIGEGGYMETEEKIKDLLKERAQFLGEKDASASSSLAASSIKETIVAASSPETYIGSDRNIYLANGVGGQEGTQTFVVPAVPELNRLYLGGTWNLFPEYGESGKDALIVYRYNAQGVYLVMDSKDGADIEVIEDGKPIERSASGEDVDASGIMHVQESRLYRIVNNQTPGEHTLELQIKSGTVHAYAFTFG